MAVKDRQGRLGLVQVWAGSNDGDSRSERVHGAEDFRPPEMRRSRVQSREAQGRQRRLRRGRGGGDALENLFCHVYEFLTSS